jgi:hypothetical protein
VRIREWVSQCVGDVVRSLFFSETVGFVQLCWVNMKYCHIRGLPVESLRVAYVDLREKRMCCVYQVFLAGCISIRIAATIGYG